MVFFAGMYNGIALNSTAIDLAVVFNEDLPSDDRRARLSSYRPDESAGFVATPEITSNRGHGTEIRLKYSAHDNRSRLASQTLSS